VEDGLALFGVQRREEIGAGHRAILRQTDYSTVTDFARFLGWSTSHPRRTATW